MIVTPHKRPACGFNVFIKSLLLLWVFSSKGLLAQDTLKLKSIEIVAKKNDLSQLGKKTETLDSTIRQQFRFNSLGEILGAITPVFVKSYGPGALATTAFRGGNAAQTAILWNGFNLQNAMLGQTDLALLPSVIFDDVEVEYGGSSALWGSGAVGGSIRLGNKNPFNKGLLTRTNLGAGSFGALNGSTHILISNQRFVSSTKLYRIHTENNFRYLDTADQANPIKNQRHAKYDFKGLMHEFKWLLNSKQMLTMNAWVNANQRSLPALSSGGESKSYQYDAAIRLTANWSYQTVGFKSLLRAAYFNDLTKYTDSMISLFSVNRVQTFMAESENYFSWGKSQQLNFGINFSNSSALSSGYRGQKSFSRVSIITGNKSSFLNGRLTTFGSLRAEYFSIGSLPITGNLSAEYVLFKNIRSKINTARVYRQPTLNDLYWQPGGNINLKPEQGYTFEGEINYGKELKRFSFFISGAAYTRKINNWILWVPGENGNPSPLNIQQVWSRGTETNCKINYSNKKIKTGLNVLTGYVLSTTMANNQENSSTISKQLIYTPRYTINTNISIAYKKISLFFFHQYIGYRYITSDNTAWLLPYHVSSAKFNYVIQIKKLNFSFFGACNNLMNNSYNILAGRPMPLRNFEIGITITTHEKHLP